MITIGNLQKSFGRRVLFENVTLNLNRAERYGLVGANGAGKSTFMNILAGKDTASDGQISVPKEVKLGFLEQDQFLNDDEIILDAVMKGDVEVFNAIKERDLLTTQDTPDVHRLDECLEIIAKNDGYTLKARSSSVLEGLGIELNYHEKPLSTLSGGFKLRVLLAQVLIASPDVLLLDEPTNHLDIVSIRWLEKYLLGYAGAVLIISHDIRFLDQVCTWILDIDYETVAPYKGNYTAFEASKEKQRALKEAEIQNVKAVIAHKQKFVDRFRAKSSKARQAQSRIKQIEKIEIPEIKQSSRRRPQFQFAQKRPSGKEVLKAESLSKSFGQKQVLKNFNLEIKRKDRLAIIGPNGIGKSTLLKILMGELIKDKGDFDFGHEVHLGYFAQDQEVGLKKSQQNVEEWIWQFCPGETVGFVRGILGRVLFTGDDVTKKVKQLSGGEVARLNLARLMIQKPNFLLLDEPTNHMDVETIEALAEALKSFEGTVLVVSHDRWFVSKIATRIVEIKKEGVNDFKGTFSEYLQDSGDDHLDVSTVLKEAVDAKRQKKQEKKDGRRLHEENKKRRALLSQSKQALRETLKSMESLEQKKDAIEKKFCEPNAYASMSKDKIKELQSEQSSLTGKIHRLTAKWEELEETIKEMEASTKDS